MRCSSATGAGLFVGADGVIGDTVVVLRDRNSVDLTTRGARPEQVVVVVSMVDAATGTVTVPLRGVTAVGLKTAVSATFTGLSVPELAVAPGSYLLRFTAPLPFLNDPTATAPTVCTVPVEVLALRVVCTNAAPAPALSALSSVGLSLEQRTQAGAVVAPAGNWLSASSAALTATASWRAPAVLTGTTSVAVSRATGSAAFSDLGFAAGTVPAGATTVTYSVPAGLAQFSLASCTVSHTVVAGRVASASVTIPGSATSYWAITSSPAATVGPWRVSLADGAGNPTALWYNSLPTDPAQTPTITVRVWSGAPADVAALDSSADGTARLLRSSAGLGGTITEVAASAPLAASATGATDVPALAVPSIAPTAAGVAYLVVVEVALGPTSAAVASDAYYRYAFGRFTVSSGVGTALQASAGGTVYDRGCIVASASATTFPSGAKVDVGVYRVAYLSSSQLELGSALSATAAVVRAVITTPTTLGRALLVAPPSGSADQATTGSDGAAYFRYLVFDRPPPGVYSISFAHVSGGGAAVASPAPTAATTITITAGPAVALSLTSASPVTVTAAGAGSAVPTITVNALEASLTAVGTHAAGLAVAVSVALNGGATPTPVTISPAPSATLVNGVASLSTLVLPSPAAGTYTVTLSAALSSGTVSVTSSVVVVPGPAVAVKVLSDASYAFTVVATRLLGDIRVRCVDSAGNNASPPSPGSTATLGFALGAPSFALGGGGTGPSSTPDAGGVMTFSAVTAVSAQLGSYTVRVVVGSLAVATIPVSISAGTAATLSPAAAEGTNYQLASDVPITNSIVVTALDATGSPVAASVVTSPIQVLASLSGLPPGVTPGSVLLAVVGGATSSAALTKTILAGTSSVTFADLVLRYPSPGAYTISFSVTGGATGVTAGSIVINISNGNVAGLTIDPLSTSIYPSSTLTTAVSALSVRGRDILGTQAVTDTASYPVTLYFAPCVAAASTCGCSYWTQAATTVQAATTLQELSAASLLNLTSLTLASAFLSVSPVLPAGRPLVRGTYCFVATSAALTRGAAELTIVSGGIVGLSATASSSASLPAAASTALPGFTVKTVDAAGNDNPADTIGSRTITASCASAPAGVTLAQCALVGASLQAVTSGIPATATFPSSSMSIAFPKAGAYVIQFRSADLLAANVTVNVVAGAPTALATVPSVSVKTAASVAIPYFEVYVVDPAGNRLLSSDLNLQRQVNVTCAGLGLSSTVIIPALRGFVNISGFSALRPNIGSYPVTFATVPDATQLAATSSQILVSVGDVSFLTLLSPAAPIPLPSLQPASALPTLVLQGRDASGTLVGTDQSPLDLNLTVAITTATLLDAVTGASRPNTGLAFNSSSVTTVRLVNGTASFAGLAFVGAQRGAATLTVTSSPAITTPFQVIVSLDAGIPVAVRRLSSVTAAPTVPTARATALPDLLLEGVDAFGNPSFTGEQATRQFLVSYLASPSIRPATLSQVDALGAGVASPFAVMVGGRITAPRLFLASPARGTHTLLFRTADGAINGTFTVVVGAGAPVGLSTSVLLSASELSPRPPPYTLQSLPSTTLYPVQVQAIDASGTSVSSGVAAFNVTLSLVDLTKEKYLAMPAAARTRPVPATGLIMYGDIVLSAPPSAPFIIRFTPSDPTLAFADVQFDLIPGPAYVVGVKTQSFAVVSSPTVTLPGITGEARDAGGSTVSSSNVAVNMTIVYAPSGGALTADQSAAAARAAAAAWATGNFTADPLYPNQALCADGTRKCLTGLSLRGTVAFDGIVLKAPPVGTHTIILTATGLTAGLGSFVVTPGQAQSLGVAAQDLTDELKTPQKAGMVVPIPAVRVTAQDPGQNTVSNAPTTLVTAEAKQVTTGTTATTTTTTTSRFASLQSLSTATLIPCNLTLNGTTTRALVNGAAVFNDLQLLRPCVGKYSIVFTSLTPGVALSAGSVPITVVSGKPSRLFMALEPPSVVSAESEINPAPKVQVVDIFGNAVAVPDLQITVTLNSGALSTGTLLAQEIFRSRRTDATGAATFPFLSVVGTRGQNFTFVFAVTSVTIFAGESILLSSVETQTFTLSPCPRFFQNFGTGCACIPGHTGLNCDACPAGQYQPQAATLSCIQCPANMDTQGATGAVSESQCQCSPRFYEVGNGGRRTCQSCPLAAACPGGQAIEPIAGYWRISASEKNTFLRCPGGADVCLGGPNSDCTVGYEGPLCATCSSGYGRLGLRCARCPNRALSTAYFIFTIIFIVGLVSFLSFSAQNLLKQRGSGIQKVFLNYVQTLALIGSFQLEFPNQLRSIFSFAQGTALLSVRISTVDCTLSLDFYKSFKAHLLLPILGILLLTVICALYVVYARLRPPHLGPGGQRVFMASMVRERVVSIAIATFFVVIFITYPLILKECLQIFSCRSLGDTRTFLNADLTVECKGRRYGEAIGLSILVLALYVVGMPLLMFVVLFYNRKRLSDSVIKQRIQLLYEGFRLDRWYWELVILVRKVAIVSVAVFLPTKPLQQAYGGLVILVASIIAHTLLQPFTTKTLQMFELLSLVTSFMTLILGLIYTANLAETGSISRGPVIAYTVFFVAINAVTAALFAMQIIKSQKTILRLTVRVLNSVGLDLKVKEEKDEDPAALAPAISFSHEAGRPSTAWGHQPNDVRRVPSLLAIPAPQYTGGSEAGPSQTVEDLLEEPEVKQGGATALPTLDPLDDDGGGGGDDGLAAGPRSSVNLGTPVLRPTQAPTSVFKLMEADGFEADLDKGMEIVRLDDEPAFAMSTNSRGPGLARADTFSLNAAAEVTKRPRLSKRSVASQEDLIKAMRLSREVDPRVLAEAQAISESRQTGSLAELPELRPLPNLISQRNAKASSEENGEEGGAQGQGQGQASLPSILPRHLRKKGLPPLVQ
jgi:hypothetical protein